jgi:phosphatidylglycerophosphatase A
MIALGLGSGLSRRAPGTVGTLFGWLLFDLIEPLFGGANFLLVILLAFAVGVPACQRTGVLLGQADHGGIVWDEIVAIWLVLALTPPTLAWQAAAFVLFRAFDILKPPPANWIDRNMKTGFGVMLDDLAAALYTLLALAVLVRVLA